jgi:GNAT superfamily N-acetyltransferase
MSGESEYRIRVFAERDEAELMELMGDTFEVSEEFLEWKYDLNPDFDRSFVLVAVNCGKVVGCMNWVPRSLKIFNSLSVRAALGADLAVHPNYRGKGLAKPLIAWENMVLEGKNMVMSYGFIDPKLAEHVHSPLIGLVEVPISTTVYTKYLDLSEIREKVGEMNRVAKSDEDIKGKLAGLDVSVLFRLRGMPPFTLRLGAGGVLLEETASMNADLRVECDLTPSELFKSERKAFTLIKALLTRKIRFRGSLRDAIKLYSLSRLLGILFL